ncbi:hypothetical protein B0H67DRAFT_172774 [Lasiosphaeris hirsuta]|uniref:Uncharacterized protein n=1 Tax=Lasiosphaeris hirsuta TaxID=260670 RepID=A0AA40E295_9PEZI|nr:hypothetical protein B0H67DRAFT_172774 [Lasiosphaeris hirsuta]
MGLGVSWVSMRTLQSLAQGGVVVLVLLLLLVSCFLHSLRPLMSPGTSGTQLSADSEAYPLMQDAGRSLTRSKPENLSCCDADVPELSQRQWATFASTASSSSPCGRPFAAADAPETRMVATCISTKSHIDQWRALLVLACQIRCQSLAHRIETCNMHVGRAIDHL